MIYQVFWKILSTKPRVSEPGSHLAGLFIIIEVFNFEKISFQEKVQISKLSVFLYYYLCYDIKVLGIN